MTYNSQSIDSKVHSNPCGGCSAKHSMFESGIDGAVAYVVLLGKNQNSIDFLAGSVSGKGLESLLQSAPVLWSDEQKSSYERQESPYKSYRHSPSTMQGPCACDCHSSGRIRSSAGTNVKDEGKEVGFKRLADSYFRNEGAELADYLSGQGREMFDLIGVGYDSIDDAVAAVKIKGDKAKLVGNYDFEDKVSRLASAYGVSSGVAKRYVLDHEHTHLWQKNMGFGFDDPIQAELDVETTLSKFYSQKASSNSPDAGLYQQLAKIASHRASTVDLNYGGRSAVNYN